MTQHLTPTTSSPASLPKPHCEPKRSAFDWQKPKRLAGNWTWGLDDDGVPISFEWFWTNRRMPDGTLERYEDKMNRHSCATLRDAMLWAEKKAANWEAMRRLSGGGRRDDNEPLLSDDDFLLRLRTMGDEPRAALSVGDDDPALSDPDFLNRLRTM
jgi:hypothetical protein